VNIPPATSKPVLFFDPRFLDHVPSPLHVERPERLRAITARLEAEGLFTEVRTAPAAAPEALERVHRRTYVEYFRDLGEGSLDPETAVHPETFGIACLAAGAAVQAARAAFAASRPAVALVRPPGHHAGTDFGGGFCYLNNVAIAAADQRAQGRRVAILDYDGHHGNGTSEIFAEDAAVLYVSTHEYGIYPGTGAAEDVGRGDGRGFTVNVPFAAGCGDASFRLAMDEVIEPVLRAFAPDVILVSLGVDAHYRDPLTSLTLSSPGYADLLARSEDLAADLCRRRFAVVLEGGYHLQALSEVIASMIGRMHGRRIELELTEVLDEAARGRAAVDAAKRALRPFWNLS